MSKNICIVISDYYKKIANGLEIGAINFCDQNSIIYEKFYVSGALEIGPAIKLISEAKHNFDGFVALGCVGYGAEVSGLKNHGSPARNKNKYSSFAASPPTSIMAHANAPARLCGDAQKPSHVGQR